jgi:hypothetical protein
MEQSDLLRKLAAELERLGIQYLVTGSIATIIYGEPRLTNDIDVVAALRLDQVDALLAAFPPPEFFCSRDAILEAIRGCLQFNILHPASGLKIDVIVPEENEFNQSRFGRRARVPGGTNFDVWLSSPEDVIIKKLEYYKEGHSEKHVRDILGVLKLRGDQVNREYVSTWADRLQLSEIWREICKRADKG